MYGNHALRLSHTSYSNLQYVKNLLPIQRNALEVLQSTPHMAPPRYWMPDNAFVGGRPCVEDKSICGREAARLAVVGMATKKS